MCHVKKYLILLLISVFAFTYCSSSSSDNESTSDYASDAESAGFTVPDAPVRGISNIYIFGSTTYDDVLDTDTAASGNTTDGVVSTDITLGSDIPSGTISIFVWINGNPYVISTGDYSGEVVSSDIVLNDGNNYICILVYVNGTLWGRSTVVRISSTVEASLARFELTWNGDGDVDLHLDNEGLGIHVYYASYYYSSSGFDIDLDVDNQIAYGPENIRVYSVPSSTAFRCFVNYFDGTSSLTATVKVYDSNNTLIDTKTASLSASDAQLSSSYDAAFSKLIGTYTVAP